MRPGLLLFLVSCTWIPGLFAQDAPFASDSLPTVSLDGGRWQLHAAAQFGFIVPHTAQMSHLITGHSAGAFVQLLHRPDPTSDWQVRYALPGQGVDLWYNRTGNPEQFGDQIALSYILRLPLNHLYPGQRAYRHWITLGIGAGYATRNWDLRENHQAPVLGSKFNAALTLQYSGRIVRVGGREITAGLRITHFSNGAFQLPNLGTNNAALFLSARIDKVQPRKVTIPPRRESFRKPFAYSAGLIIGAKEIPPPLGRKYFSYTFSLHADWRFRYKSSIGLSADAMYNSSLEPLLRRRDGDPVPFADVWQLGLAAGYTMHFHKVWLRIQQGMYIRDEWKDTGLFYHRVGLRYTFHPHWFAQLNLKTHFAKADHGELGIGHTF